MALILTTDPFESKVILQGDMLSFDISLYACLGHI